MSRYNPERRIPADLPHVFAFRTRDGYAAAAPTLTVFWPSGSRSYSLTSVRTADRITEVSTDGRDITVECATPPGSTIRGVILELGGYAWIDGGAVYQGPARVMRLVSQTGPVAGVVTAVLRLAEPLPEGVAPVVSYSGATGQLARTIAPFVAGDAFDIYGVAFTYIDNGGSGNLGTAIDIGGDPTDAEMAERVAAAITDANLGITATVTGDVDVDLVGGADDPIVGLPAPGPYTATGLTGATDTGTWHLRWAVYTATIDAAHVGAVRLRNVRWEVPWTRRQGADAPTLARRDDGFLHVSRVPFSTGLEDSDLYAHVPGWARLVPDRQASWAEQRWLAEDELVARLRPRLRAGCSEDDVLAEQFRRPHALLTAATILRGQAALGYAGAAESAEALHTMALEALDLAFASLTYLDANGNRVVDAGETGLAMNSVSAFDATAFDDDCDGPARARFWDER